MLRRHYARRFSAIREKLDSAIKMPPPLRPIKAKVNRVVGRTAEAAEVIVVVVVVVVVGGSRGRVSPGRGSRDGGDSGGQNRDGGGIEGSAV